MNKELPSSESFGFTDKAQLWDRMYDKRFQQMFDDPDTHVHEITLDSNEYGEFLFVTVSRPHQDKRTFVTFYGLGYHEHRERRFTNEWHWFDEPYRAAKLEPIVIEKEAAKQQLQERREEIQPFVGQVSQSEHGRLFEMLADLTDDDGAQAEMEDLGDITDWLGDTPDE